MIKVLLYSLKIFTENSSCKSFSDSDDVSAKGNPFTSTKSIKVMHPKNLFFNHLNVNSLRNKFVSIQELIKSTFDIFLISETKIDDSFPNAQFKLKVLGKIEMPLGEDFSFTLMKS